MKAVIAPDSSKESLSAEKCCQAAKAGSSTLFPDANYIYLPIADDGEGTVDAMVVATGGNIVMPEVCEPISEKVDVFCDLIGDGKTAVIEMAAASGLMLVVPEKRNPLLASSFGTGELIRHALDNNVRHIILSIGGSATVDGGMGMAQALGVRFLDADGQALAANGGNLACVASIEVDECDLCLASCHIEVVCDVDSPLVGTRGVAVVLGLQKGATPEMVEGSEQRLQNYARVLQQQTEVNVCQVAGGGAVGGMSIAVAVFLNTDIKPDIEIVLNAVNLVQAVQGVTLAIIGEGHTDSQTTGGKAPLGVAPVAKQFSALVIGIAGVLGGGMEAVHQYGIDAVSSILPRLAPLAEVLANGKTNLFSST